MDRATRQRLEAGLAALGDNDCVLVYAPDLRALLAALPAEPPTDPGGPVCPECGGRGEILDAPGRVLDGRAYYTPCPVCRSGT